MHKRLSLLLLALLLHGSTSPAQTPSPPQALLAKYCIHCHGADEQNAQVRFDNLAGYQPRDEQFWTKVYEAVSLGDMPPEDEPQPSDVQRRQILDWIETQQRSPHAEAVPTHRRLNRREFGAALQDATGTNINFAAGLPDDGKVEGFDTGALGLQDAADSVDQYLEVTRRAVDSIRFLEPEPNQKLSIDFREHEFNDYRKFLEKRYDNYRIFTRSKRLICVPDVGLYLQTQWSGDRGNSFLAVPAPDDHRAALHVKVRVFGQRPLPGLPMPTLWVKIGGSYIDYQPIGEEPQTLTYAIRMEDHLIEDGVIKIMLRCVVEVPYAVDGFENDDRSKPTDNIPGGIGVYRPKFDRKKFRTPDVQPVPSIVVESIDVDYDYQAAWPPTDWQVDVGPQEESDAYAARLLQLWMDRAWRRPTSADERAKFLALYQQLREEGLSFDDAMRSTFQAVLMGGPFRYLAAPGDIATPENQFAFASRISFMLWGAPPDKQLQTLAAQGQLSEPAVLNAQLNRMLADRRSDAFFEPFVVQWLNLNQPITLVMSHFKKQDFRFGRHLKDSMKRETIDYVARLFRENRQARQLIDSDWTMMNDILAVHYDYEGISGGSLRPVDIKVRPEDQRGGGILGHAGIQSMLCWMGDNWVIYRGAWALTHLLDDPPPPPPLEVPELNPADEEHYGKTYRELLAIHQQDPNCSVCHRKIDPFGFAFQNFDLSGRWRNVEHEKYHRYELDGKVEWRGEGQTRPVDAAGRLPRGEEFTSFAEFKTILAEHYLEDIVRGLLKKLTLYGTGRTANVADLAIIDAIMQAHADEGYPLGDMLKELIQPPLFLR